MPSPASQKREIVRLALALGFDVCRFAKASLPRTTGDRLRKAVADGFHGSMDWLEQTIDRRVSPKAMWPQARTAIVLGMNYGPDSDPMDMLERKTLANISVYARHRDYHDVIKGRLKQIAQRFAAASGAEAKVFVDTAPLMEKPLAEQAGAGWQGKHTNLVSREFGSWLFLGVILTSAEFEPDQSEEDHCGSCRACLDICPTKAFPAPYQLDARRCISYLTIENKGPLPRQFRRAMGNRIYGCDDCLAVCPWNKFAVKAKEAKLVEREDLKSPSLSSFLRLDDLAFRARFSGSPVKRIGRSRFLRNVLIAAGNSDAPELVKDVAEHLHDSSAIVRGAAVWALSKLESRPAFRDRFRAFTPTETDPTVLEEWQAAMEIVEENE